MATIVNGEGDGEIATTEFCERHASSSAQTFVRHFLAFDRNTPSVGRSRDPNDYAKKFTEFFLRHFDYELKRSSFVGESLAEVNNTNHREPTTNLTGSEVTRLRRGAHNGETDDYADQESNSDRGVSPGRKNQKGILRRLSFKNIRKSRLFKQTSDEVESGGGCAEAPHPHHHNNNHHRKSSKYKEKKHKGKLMNSRNEGGVKREGIVHVLQPGEDSKGRSKWEKTRLVLVKATGGYLLEFYSPPKSVKPRTGLLCMLITEVRETTALEMPDRENTLVLKGNGPLEYVIEASDSTELRMWIQAIHHCIDPVPESLSSEEGAVRPRLPTAPSGSIERKDSSQLTPARRSSSQGSLGSNTPDIPPRPTPRPWSMGHSQDLLTSHNHSNPDVAARLDSSFEQDPGEEGSIDTRLREYPWFHGTLSRADAAQLVLQQGPSGHGVFLVRKSETRTGEYVLTFNFQGRAKHLRMNINSDRKCRVQHLWFETIFDMLEHFRTHPIPLESGGTSDVTLTDYIVAIEAPHTPSSLPRNLSRGAGGGIRGSFSAHHGMENRDVVVVSGSVRSRTSSIENVVREQSSGAQQHGTRAVDNHYSFV
ncbi:SH2B adapter protein 1-like [Babylonia areolata]|uniref:SH2B adapter protein 1-like n=1 Tax=Babylonia areolata TaxID=304850 RepID=UPI003FD04BFB